jgi:hypothetical protein
MNMSTLAKLIHNYWNIFNRIAKTKQTGTTMV